MSLSAHRLRADDLCTPIGLATGTPLLSWSLASAESGQRQTALAVQAGRAPGASELWSSGWVPAAVPRVTYGGTPVPSRTRVYWRVRVRDGLGRESAWSEPSWFETALGERDWAGHWITHPDWVHADPEPAALPVLATEFEATEIASARFYVAGVGVWVATINGEPVSDAVLEPPNSDFRASVDFASYDVTSLLRTGRNALEVRLGTGIAAVFPVADRYTKFTGVQSLPMVIAQLEIVAADGRRTVVATDADWRAGLGPTVRSHWYGGEDFDARRVDPEWRSAVVVTSDRALHPRQAPPIRVTERIPAVAVTEPEPGVHVVDLGVNIAGWPLLTVDSPAGREIRLVPGELLDERGRVTQHTTGSPIFDTYRTTGGPQSWHPEFTYHGFRYVEVHGLGGGTVEGLVLRADNEVVGSFRCSDELFNGIHALIDRAVRGNMFSVPTDCPHREKLGWLEQAHLLGQVLARGYDVNAYLRDLLRRMVEAQTEDGLIPSIAPEYVVFPGGFRDDPNWGGAIVLLPWEHYRAYGDIRILADHYEPMRRYLDYLAGQADRHLLDHGLGDWITVDESTPRALVATWGYHRAVTAMARISEVLGRPFAACRALADEIGAAFHREFFDPVATSYGSGSQASQILALDLGIVPADVRPRVLARLENAIADAGEHLTVGEVALPAAFRVLAAADRNELLYRIARRTDHPSYGYQLAHGATALTEAWNGPTRGISQNHFMLGAIDDWFTGTLAGLGQTEDSAGYREILIAPTPVGDLTSAAAEIRTSGGRLACAWSRESREPGQFRLEVEIPVGSTAVVRPPAGAGTWDVAPGPDGWRVGSGRWGFTRLG